MKKNTTLIGQNAERIAEEFYLRQGYSLVERNFRTPRGEIDLVLWREPELLLVEVKGRKSFLVDEAWATRWRQKKGRIRLALRSFLASNPEFEDGAEEMRLEIVFVTQGRVRHRWESEAFF